jgi:hypothetical protein
MDDKQISTLLRMEHHAPSRDSLILCRKMNPRSDKHKHSLHLARDRCGGRFMAPDASSTQLVDASRVVIQGPCTARMVVVAAPPQQPDADT